MYAFAYESIFVEVVTNETSNKKISTRLVNLIGLIERRLKVHDKNMSCGLTLNINQ